MKNFILAVENVPKPNSNHTYYQYYQNCFCNEHRFWNILYCQYKDYETALYKYAGDGTEQTERLFTDIIGKEAAKKRLLPLKEES